MRERVTMTGELDPATFVPWIQRHASKLGLCPSLLAVGPRRIEMEIVGEGDLIDMLAIGCSLGPIGVWVDAIHRVPGGREAFP